MSASSDTSVLFSTDHGSVDWTHDGHFSLSLPEFCWTSKRADVAALHEAIQPLAAQVYRCDCNCKWQVRVEGQATAVLSSDQVLRLHSLLDGAMTMLELHDMLDDAGIDLPVEPTP